MELWERRVYDKKLPNCHTRIITFNNCQRNNYSLILENGNFIFTKIIIKHSLFQKISTILILFVNHEISKQMFQNSCITNFIIYSILKIKNPPSSFTWIPLETHTCATSRLPFLKKKQSFSKSLAQTLLP